MNMASQEQRRTQTRQKIVQAAKKLFDRQGFEATSVDQIVKAADVAKGTFYQYYETKVDVLADLTRDEGAEKTRAALEAVANGAPAIPMLERYLQAMCEWFESHEKIAEALIFSSLKSIGREDSLDQHRYGRRFLVALFTLAQEHGELRHDVAPGELAKVIGGALVMSVLGWSKNPVPGALAKSMNETLKVFLQGAKSRASL